MTVTCLQGATCSPHIVLEAHASQLTWCVCTYTHHVEWVGPVCDATQLPTHSCKFFLYVLSFLFLFVFTPFPFVTFGHDCFVVFVCPTVKLLTTYCLVRISILAMRTRKGGIGCTPKGIKNGRVKGKGQRSPCGVQSATFRPRRGSLHGSLFCQSTHVPKSSMSVRRVGVYGLESERMQDTYILGYSGSKGRH